MATATHPSSTVTTIADAKHTADSDAAAPIILDFGKQRRKDVKRLRRGEGKLLDEVRAALDELRTAGAVTSNAQPVIIVVQQKRRRTTSFLPSL